MYEDIIGSSTKDKCHHSSYLKPVHNRCEECNLTLTVVDGKGENEPCPICGKLLVRRNYDYLTTISG